MRDINKNESYFHEIIKNFNDHTVERKQLLTSNKIEVERIPSFKCSIFTGQIKCLIAKYSLGIDLFELSNDVRKLCVEMNSLWSDFWLYYYRNNYLSQYINSAYDEMIWMLSFAILLKVDDESFIKLTEIIDRNKVVDILFEKIISFRDSTRKPFEKESYHPKIQFVPNDFKSIRTAVLLKDKKEMEKLLGNYVSKEWYKNHINTGWCTKTIKDGYLGYWCFEAAAFVAILDLDDSSFRDCPYYPKDLVDYFRSK